MLDSKTISFIIPVLNEAESLRRNLPHYHYIQGLKAGQIKSEIIFVDGGSKDQSCKILVENDFTVLSSEKGRSRQLNTGAQHSSGDVLVFLHGDTIIPNDIESLFSSILNAKWGFFRIALSNQMLAYRVISAGINIRSWVFKQATGDQVIFFDRHLFFSMGTYADIPLMEDIEITRRAKKLYKPYIIKSRVISSSRRWEKNGVIKTMVFMWFIQLCYAFGVSTNTLARWYYPNTEFPRNHK